MSQKSKNPRSTLTEVIACAKNTVFWIKRFRFESSLCYRPAKGKQLKLSASQFSQLCNGLPLLGGCCKEQTRQCRRKCVLH